MRNVEGGGFLSANYIKYLLSVLDVSYLCQQMHLFRRSLVSLNALTRRAFLPDIVAQYETNAGRVLKHVLPYESTPSPARRRGLDSDKLVLVAHCARSQDGTSKVTLSCGFALDVQGEAEDVVVTCAHTLEEVWTCNLQMTSPTTHADTPFSRAANLRLLRFRRQRFGVQHNAC